jgi:arsenite/tail-anchored protein-transporting ATPase
VFFLSGKGGTGKTAVSVGLARALARRGKRCLIVEIDAPRPNLPAYFGGQVDAKPRKVAPRIDGCNVDFYAALRAYVESVVHVKTVVGLILRNRVVKIFLTATPGARELVLLSRLWEFSWDPRWDHIIVDLPASGHALALMRCPFLAKRTFARGPLRKRADEIIERFSDPNVAGLYFCALPGEMPINETLETRQILVGLGMPPVGGAFLNQFPDESFENSEKDLLGDLGAVFESGGGEGPSGVIQPPMPPAVRAAVEAATETRRNQVISQDGLGRLRSVFGEEMVGKLPVLPGTHSQVADAISLIITGWL